MLGALLCLCGMAVAGRELSVELNAFQITFLRSVVCIAAILLLLCAAGFSRVRSRQKKMHVARNAIHFAGQVGWLYGVAVLPLAEVFAIEFTAPIWTAILATVLLRERLSRHRLLAIVLGFAGIMIILRPGVAAIQPAALVVLFAAVCFASTYVFTRHMSASETPLTVIFYRAAPLEFHRPGVGDGDGADTRLGRTAAACSPRHRAFGNRTYVLSEAESPPSRGADQVSAGSRAVSVGG